MEYLIYLKGVFSKIIHFKKYITLKLININATSTDHRSFYVNTFNKRSFDIVTVITPVGKVHKAATRFVGFES